VKFIIKANLREIVIGYEYFYPIFSIFILLPFNAIYFVKLANKLNFYKHFFKPVLNILPAFYVI